MRNGEQRGPCAQEHPRALLGIRRETRKQESSCTGSKEPSLELYLFFSFTPIQLENLEKAMAPHSSTLAWKIPWMEEPRRLQSMGSQRVGHD